MNFESISDEDGIMLVQMARSVVTEYITNNNKISEQNFKEKFSFNAGVFVTINDKSGLRGCIGFPLAVKKLSDALTSAAISASTDDPRFPSIKQDELNDLVFEVTVLSDTKEISTNSPDEIINSIKIGRDGLIIEKDFQSGLLLPQVPIEYNWNVEDFLKHTCHKAGLSNESWKDKTTKISKFQGLIFREVLPNGEIIREKFQ
tara:strand:+ start:1002 stop:1610 length:609 start_codon:yes stop_codon:yes gene_type:complete